MSASLAHRQCQLAAVLCLDSMKNHLLLIPEFSCHCGQHPHFVAVNRTEVNFSSNWVTTQLVFSSPALPESLFSRFLRTKFKVTFRAKQLALNGYREKDRGKGREREIFGQVWLVFILWSKTFRKVEILCEAKKARFDLADRVLISFDWLAARLTLRVRLTMSLLISGFTFRFASARHLASLWRLWQANESEYHFSALMLANNHFRLFLCPLSVAQSSTGGGSVRLFRLDRPD